MQESLHQENPYNVPPSASSEPPVESSAPPAGFALRFLAYLIDVLPITLVVAMLYIFFMGMGDTLKRYASDPRNIEARIAFLRQRNQVRDLSLLVNIVYCSLAESSSLQGTLGKRLLGIRVTDIYGHRLTIGGSFGRNLSKLISALPCALGFLWAIWSPRGQAWHDSIAKALVTKS